jgi:hypothetical protein
MVAYGRVSWGSILRTGEGLVRRVFWDILGNMGNWGEPVALGNYRI